MKNIESRLRMIEAAVQAIGRRGPRTARDMSEAELLEIIGLGDNPTDEQLQAIIDGEGTA
jgi:hypothetical protein